jgi:hypothetical protein
MIIVDTKEDVICLEAISTAISYCTCYVLTHTHIYTSTYVSSRPYGIYVANYIDIAK